MKTSKSFVGSLGAALLPIMLCTFGVAWGVYQLLASPDSLKSGLAESGIYESAVDHILETSGIGTENTSLGMIAIHDPVVQAAISAAIPPETLQQQSEEAIDTFYRWMHGEAGELRFDIRLDTRTDIADKVAAYAAQRTEELPICADRTDTSLFTNPLAATCKPAVLDSAAVAQAVQTEVLNNIDAVPYPLLTTSDTADGDGSNLEQRLRTFPAVYEQVRWGTVISGIAAILCIAAVLRFSGTLPSGLRRLGWIFIPVGIGIILLGWGIGFALSKGAEMLMGSGSNIVQSRLLEALSLMTIDVRVFWIYLGGLFVVIGGGSFVSASILRKRYARILPDE